MAMLWVAPATAQSFDASEEPIDGTVFAQVSQTIREHFDGAEATDALEELVAKNIEAISARAQNRRVTEHRIRYSIAEAIGACARERSYERAPTGRHVLNLLRLVKGEEGIERLSYHSYASAIFIKTRRKLDADEAAHEEREAQRRAWAKEERRTAILQAANAALLENPNENLGKWFLKTYPDEHDPDVFSQVLKLQAAFRQLREPMTDPKVAQGLLSRIYARKPSEREVTPAEIMENVRKGRLSRKDAALFLESLAESKGKRGTRASAP